LRNPITGTADCCARALSGHDTAAPPRRLRMSLRLMGFPRVLRSAEGKCGRVEDQGVPCGRSARISSPGRARSHWKFVRPRRRTFAPSGSLGVVKKLKGAGNASRAADGTGRRDWFGAVMRSGPLRCGQIALRPLGQLCCRHAHPRHTESAKRTSTTAAHRPWGIVVACQRLPTRPKGQECHSPSALLRPSGEKTLDAIQHKLVLVMVPGATFAVCRRALRGTT
jgi:hypothetical protein